MPTHKPKRKCCLEVSGKMLFWKHVVRSTNRQRTCAEDAGVTSTTTTTCEFSDITSPGPGHRVPIAEQSPREPIAALVEQIKFLCRKSKPTCPGKHLSLFVANSHRVVLLTGLYRICTGLPDIQGRAASYSCRETQCSIAASC